MATTARHRVSTARVKSPADLQNTQSRGREHHVRCARHTAALPPRCGGGWTGIQPARGAGGARCQQHRRAGIVRVFGFALYLAAAEATSFPVYLSLHVCVAGAASVSAFDAQARLLYRRR